MRLAALLPALVLVTGCSEDGLSSMPDMSMPPPEDMAVMMKIDMRMKPMPLGCAGIVQCLQSGGGECFMNATPMGLSLLQAMFDCGVSKCLPNDAGIGECVDEQDQSQECLMCAIGAIQGGQCPSETAACLGDT